MSTSRRHGRPEKPRTKPVPKPLDPIRIEELALAYVARFATSAGKLSAYLARKLRERGWEGDAPADLPALIARFVERGYIDDAGYARAKGQGLLRRGYGARRIDEALGHAGIAEDLRAEARGTEAERRHAALAFARKRRAGPFGPGPGSGSDENGEGDGDGRRACLDRVTREKQVAAFLRAGHPLAFARALVEAGSITEAEEWADEELD